MATRVESDLLGSREIPVDALWGIHTLRAVENFPLSGRKVAPSLIHAFGLVKKSCAKTNHELGAWDDSKYAAIAQACEEMAAGALDAHIVVDALQGGAGTSTNMNVNEILANRAIAILGGTPGDYAKVHPIDDINLHQSTNDAYPTALKVAAIASTRRLEAALVKLLESFQRKEREFAHVVKVGRTQYQDAVLTTLGRSMSCYAEAFGRDRWRVYKCEERLRVVNLGGTAIGTGISAPKKYIFRVVENLKSLTGFGLARAENLVDATQNCDVYVEVSGILNGCAANIVKTCNDLRLMSSGPDAGLAEISLPPMQAGSSIMPGKVNPVIPEAAIQAALEAQANSNAIFAACSAGSLELNAFLPLVADKLLNSLDILANACEILAAKCVDGIKANEDVCRRHVEGSTATLTALVGSIGYERAQSLLKLSRERGVSIKEAAIAAGILDAAQFDSLISSESVMRLGS